MSHKNQPSGRARNIAQFLLSARNFYNYIGYWGNLELHIKLDNALGIHVIEEGRFGFDDASIIDTEIQLIKNPRAYYGRLNPGAKIRTHDNLY